MKKLLVLALTLPVFTVVMGGANCSGGGTTCTSDAECDGTTNSAGEDTPYCDTEAQICVPDMGECAEDYECQLINPAAPTTVEDCSSNADCGDGEFCVETTGGTVCAVDASGAGACGDDVSINVDDIEGGSADVCASADGTCETNGGCTF